jgi:predicted HicB family RNase H-like nuclease
MKRIINGRTYSTETADLICTLSCPFGRSDFHWHDTAMYRTKGGAYFLAGEGNAMSMWSRSVDRNSWGPGEGIKPLAVSEAQSILEEEGETDAVEKWFGEQPEAAGEEERDGFPLRLPRSVKAAAERRASEQGVSLNAWIVDLVKSSAA